MFLGAWRAARGKVNPAGGRLRLHRFPGWGGRNPPAPDTRCRPVQKMTTAAPRPEQAGHWVNQSRGSRLSRRHAPPSPPASWRPSAFETEAAPGKSDFVAQWLACEQGSRADTAATNQKGHLWNIVTYFLLSVSPVLDGHNFTPTSPMNSRPALSRVVEPVFDRGGARSQAQAGGGARRLARGAGRSRRPILPGRLGSGEVGEIVTRCALAGPHRLPGAAQK
jgi:hypothetical protein